MKRDLLPNADGAAVAAGLPGMVAAPWRYALPLVTLVVLWVLGWYATTGSTMVETWARSQTFSHGFVVVPIVVWLIWRKRSELAALTPAPAWWALGGVALAGAAWFLGELATVNAVSQLALTALIVLAVLTVVGTTVGRELAFPLGFLFFAVPIGEFVTPQLMAWTADFVVAALRVTGVPVYREGLQFVIPSGSWSVVEACSGLRYLVASLMVGTLFAYLSYRSLTKRLVFIACAFIVPIVANWLRAYLIVMLGHLTNNQLAAGVDHLIYGWVFFGLVMGIMLWLGARWRDDEALAPAPARASSAGPGVEVRTRAHLRLFAGAAAVAFLVMVWRIGYWSIEAADASTPARLVPLAQVSGWRTIPEPVSRWRPEFKDPSDQLHATFASGSQRVGLFVAYYRHQGEERKLVSSENVLERSEDPTWATVATGAARVEAADSPLPVRTAELRGIDGQRLIVWQWYWVNGRVTASDHVAKAHTALARLEGAGDDGAAIVIYTAKEAAGGPEAVLESFVRAARPHIEAALARTRDTR
jgi:exosortase A